MDARTCLGTLFAACVAASGLAASEYHGTVKAGGLPLPGATVTATQGDKKFATTTDDAGAFAFPDLPDGTWTLEVEMLGFARYGREVGVARIAPSPDIELKLLAKDALVAALNPGRAPRPQPARPRTGYQNLDVRQAAQTSAFGGDGTLGTENTADLSQSSANSFTLQGSMSSALGLPQRNDWGFGPPMGPGMDPLAGGAPPMGMGMAGLAPGAGDGPPTAAMQGGGPRMAMGGGPGGGPGPMGGPGGGRMGGPGGGPPMGGPGGGPMGGPGGFGGFGGPRGGPGMGRPGWQGRPGSMAFGNARRNPRNSYMASAFFSLDNSAWDARTFSVTGAAVNKPSYANARAGVMFGGPLYIPKLVSRQKHILFAFNYEVLRNRTGTVSEPVNMPTALERTGDFSQTFLSGRAVTIYDPATGLPFAGNSIPLNQISPAALALLDYFPSPNLPFSARNYQTSWSGSNNSQMLNARIMNASVTPKDRLSGGIGYQGSNNSTPNLFAFTDTGSGRGINANVMWSHNISSRLINSVRYNFSRMRQLSTPYFANRENVAADLGIAGTSQNSLNWGPPNLSFSNYGSLTDGNASLSRNQTGSAGDSLLWIHGTHNATFGGDYRRQQFNQFADANGRGTYSFNGSLTGYDLADFLLGVPTTAAIRYGNADKYFRGSGADFFVNDDWRISTKLSLNGGLRWEYASPVSELYNRLVNLQIAPGFSAITAVTPSAGLPSGLIHSDLNNFSPRIGFAWRPTAKGSMVVRGGYGIYYNTSVYNMVASNLAQQPPFAQVLSASQSASNPFTITNGFLLATGNSAGSTYAIDPNYRIGYAQTWMISVQHDLPLGMFATAGYLGTRGTRLDQQFLPNSVAPGAAVSLLPHGYTYETSNGNSIYHAAQFQLNRRMRSGLMAHASYQFSKSIDNAGTGGRGQGNTPVAQNWLDLSAERGLSSFDSRHNLMLQMQYSTGMGTAGGTLVNGWKGALMKDWTISGNISLHSGNPFTATYSGDHSQVNGTAIINITRASATGLPVTAEGQVFNTAAFSAPLAGEWGDAGRNTIPGPTVFYLNGSVGRIFRLGERRSADLQFQAQNLLNHVTITNWGTNVGTANYGLATNAAAMRRITASLRFRF